MEKQEKIPGGIKANEEVVEVGGKKLTVREMVISQRDFLFERLRGYGIANLLYGEAARTGGVISGKSIIGAIEEALGKLGSKDLGEIAVNALNIRANREVVGVKDAKDFITWAQETMTWQEESRVVRAIFNVNGLEEILKNYQEIGRVVSGLFQSRKQQSEPQPDSASTPK